MIFAACTNGSSTPTTDAPKQVDAGAGDAAGALCTGAAFDPCTMTTQCMSMNCKLFNSAGIQVCTVTCTPGDNTTCPLDVSGNHATCNNMGICKPSAANACHR